MSFKLDTASLNRVKAQLKGRGKEYEAKLAHEVDKGASKIHKDAVSSFHSQSSKDKFPHEFKTYVNRIQPKFYTGLPVADVVAQTEIMAYLEFGTGVYAKEYLSGQPENVRRLARTFFKTGKGTLRAFPYLIPSFEQNRSKIVNKLRSIKI
jgi:hypothetical protein